MVSVRISDELELVCPACGGANLHHETLEWWTREREDGEASVQILGKPITGASRNPSSRRDGVRIRFFCEHGCDVPPLDIRQHKGTTYVSWGE